MAFGGLRGARILGLGFAAGSGRVGAGDGFDWLCSVRHDFGRLDRVASVRCKDAVPVELRVNANGMLCAVVSSGCKLFLMDSRLLEAWSAYLSWGSRSFDIYVK